MIGMELGAPLAYALGTEHHQPILRMLEGNGDRLREGKLHCEGLCVIWNRLLINVFYANNILKREYNWRPCATISTCLEFATHLIFYIKIWLC